MDLPSTAPTFWLGRQVIGWHHIYILCAAVTVLSIIGGVFLVAFWKPKTVDHVYESVAAFARFFYASFLKPHTGDGSGGQQAALENFYKAQVRRWSGMAGKVELTGASIGRCVRCHPQEAPMWSRGYARPSRGAIEAPGGQRCVVAVGARLGGCKIICPRAHGTRSKTC